MTHAYPNLFVAKAQKKLGYCIDVCINALHMSTEETVNLFLDSGMPEYFEEGNPRFVVGRSGKELVMDCHYALGLPEPNLRGTVLSREAEYWAGWALAYYQWWSNKPFAEILSKIPLGSLIGAYFSLHEVSLQKVVCEMDAAMESNESTVIPTTKPIAKAVG